MKKLFLIMAFLTTISFSKEFTLNIKGSEDKENIVVKVPFDIDEKGKIVSEQRINVKNLKNITDLMIISAPGLKGTIIDEREVVVFYKTSLEMSGMKIKNLYKVGVGRVYYDEDNINIQMDNDYYQNIYSFLQYHNINRNSVQDLENINGNWLIVLAPKKTI